MNRIIDFIITLDRLELSLFRKTEKAVLKLSKCSSAVLFNSICVKERILPKYSNVRSTDTRNQNARNYVSFRHNTVLNELARKEKEHVQLKKLLQESQLDFLSGCRNFISQPFLDIMRYIQVHEDTSKIV